jgi:hypothetical protein
MPASTTRSLIGEDIDMFADDPEEDKKPALPQVNLPPTLTPQPAFGGLYGNLFSPPVAPQQQTGLGGLHGSMPQPMVGQTTPQSLFGGLPQPMAQQQPPSQVPSTAIEMGATQPQAIQTYGPGLLGPYTGGVFTPDALRQHFPENVRLAILDQQTEPSRQAAFADNYGGHWSVTLRALPYQVFLKRV